MGARAFLDRYKSMGHELTGRERTRQAIRVNTLVTEHDELRTRLNSHGVILSRIPWLRDGYYVERSNFSLGASIEYLLGFYSIQEAAAQFPVEVMAPIPGETVLDMCAAPGGKTTQSAALMKNFGALFAVDVSRKRLYSLENNIERCNVENCAVFWGDASWMDLNVSFDRVLLDAPCSGNYVIDPLWFRKRTLRDVEVNAERQRKLLVAAVRFLKSGGILVYTTCSLEPEENELNIQWLLEGYPVRLEEVIGIGSPGLTEAFGSRLSDEMKKCRRFWPDVTGTQGYFVAKVVKI